MSRAARIKKEGLLCGMTGKVNFPSYEAAMDRAEQVLENENVFGTLATYECVYCGKWHLTTKEQR